MKIVDLFSGAGGLTFGFYYKLINGDFVRGDNEFIFANEFNPDAAKAFQLNFPDIQMIQDDIKNLTESRVKALIKDEVVDLIIGGPPCQSFSTVGRRRYDDKAKLYEEYIRLLKIIKPRMFLFENVKGILSMREVFYKVDLEGKIVYKEKITIRNGKELKRKVPVVDYYGDLVMDKIKEQFDNIGYEIRFKTLNAVNYGVPQNRERVFIIGIRKDLNMEWEFPEDNQQSHITIKQAISDLPTLGEAENICEYNQTPTTEYQKLMRGKCEKLTCHFCGSYGDKIRTVIKNVKQGQGKEDFNALVDNGKIPEKYRLTSGYKNTYGRLMENQPSPTITNNLCTPSGLRCIHYEQNRALSPREGARIQSFPDSFQFYGNKEAITTQIGNAVPPLLALSIAIHIKKCMESIV